MERVPTLKQVIKQYQKLIVQQGFHDVEAFEDVVGDLLAMCKAYKDAANGWMKAHDKLKEKYEPMVAEFSEE